MTYDQAENELKFMLCDKCLYRVETDPTVPVADLCDRCRKKLLAALFGAAEDFENLS